MRKPGLLNLIKQLNVKYEDREHDNELVILMLMELVVLLLDYINDKDIRTEVDEVIL